MSAPAADRSPRRPSGWWLPVWEYVSRRALARFDRQLGQAAAVNRGVLRGILRHHSNTDFGRRHGFRAILRDHDLVSAWRRSVPVSTYADFADDIASMAGGARDVLFAGKPSLFVSTSGTTGDPKLFPLSRRQQNIALLWVTLMTPAARARCVPGFGFRQPAATLLVASRPGQQTAGGVPVGNPSGAGLRRLLALFTPPFWVFPPAVLEVRDTRSALYLHALFALRRPDLGCIEAIFCSHVVSWMEMIVQRGEELVTDIGTGRLSPQLALGDAEKRALLPYLAPDPARAAEVAHELSRGVEALMSRLWPSLQVVSSIVSGPFAVSVPRLRALAGPGPVFYTTCFGATEAMVGINLWLDHPEHYALALGAAHFEFLPMRDGGVDIAAAHDIDEVEVGKSYEVAVTTHAGLYRYRLGDVVRITGREKSTPVFEFDHRLGNVLDLVGEKTTEEHVRSAVRAALPAGMGAAGFALSFDAHEIPYRYICYVELAAGRQLPGDRVVQLAAALDDALATVNPGYRTLARNNGRLATLEARIVRQGTFNGWLEGRRDHVPSANANQVKLPHIVRDPRDRALLESGVAMTSRAQAGPAGG